MRDITFWTLSTRKTQLSKMHVLQALQRYLLKVYRTKCAQGEALKSFTIYWYSIMFVIAIILYQQILSIKI